METPVKPEVIELEDDEAQQPTPSILLSDQNKIQVTIKKDVWTKPYLLCELQDELVNFDGDSGAIGRFTIGNDKLEIDLKGRQFSGQLRSGPLVLMLNIAPPVGQAKSAVVGRVEAVSSEYCQLDFQRDMMSDLQGIFSGDLTSAGLVDNGEDSAKKTATKRDRKTLDDVDLDIESDGSSKPLEKRLSIRDNPKISTITNRQRVSKTKKTVKKKKTVSGKKK